MGVSFHLASRVDAQRMTQFHNNYYGTRRASSHWEWLYFGWRPENAVFAYAMNAEGQIIATQGMVPYPISVDGQTVLSSKSESTLMLPEGRGSGLMVDLYDFAFVAAVDRGSSVVWGFTDSDRAFQRFGFQTFPIAHTYERRGRSLVRGALGRLQAPDSARHRFLSMSRHIHGMLTHRRLASPPSAMVSTTTLSVDDARVAWCRLLSTSPVAGVQLSADHDYFDWRWGRNPTTDFEFLGSVSGDPLQGLAVVSRAAGRTVISDVQTCDPEDRPAVLAAVVARLAPSTGAFRVFVNERAPAGLDGVALERLGFAHLSQTNLVVRAAPATTLHSLDDPASWNFSYAWTEGIGA